MSDRTERLTRKLSWLAALVLLLVGVSCSVKATLSYPDCQGGGSSLIVAQSVASADLVPCFEGIPDGWEVDTVSVTHDGTSIKFDSDRVGRGAAEFRFDQSCQPAAAKAVASEWVGVDVFEVVERRQPGYAAHRYYLFDGGCIWWSFDFTGDESAERALELRDRLTLLTRTYVNQGVHDSFMERDL